MQTKQRFTDLSAAQTKSKGPATPPSSESESDEEKREEKKKRQEEKQASDELEEMKQKIKEGLGSGSGGGGGGGQDKVELDENGEIMDKKKQSIFSEREIDAVEDTCNFCLKTLSYGIPPHIWAEACRR